MSNLDRVALRKQFRQKRNSLSRQQQTEAANATLSITANLLSNTTKIACYLANDGELNPSAIINYCWQQHKQVLLPVLDPSQAGHLIFVEYQENSPVRTNHYGIPEPIITINNVIPVLDIDLIFTPLVAFDVKGNRLGMGGGYYDRTLAPINEQACNTQLIGLAHDCQQANSLPIDGWDIPLHGIATPSNFFNIA